MNMSSQSCAIHKITGILNWYQMHSLCIGSGYVATDQWSVLSMSVQLRAIVLLLESLHSQFFLKRSNNLRYTSNGILHIKGNSNDFTGRPVYLPCYSSSCVMQDEIALEALYQVWENNPDGLIMLWSCIKGNVGSGVGLHFPVIAIRCVCIL